MFLLYKLRQDISHIKSKDEILLDLNLSLTLDLPGQKGLLQYPTIVSEVSSKTNSSSLTSLPPKASAVNIRKHSFVLVCLTHMSLHM